MRLNYMFPLRKDIKACYEFVGLQNVNNGGNIHGTKTGGTFGLIEYLGPRTHHHLPLPFSEISSALNYIIRSPGPSGQLRL